MAGLESCLLINHEQREKQYSHLRSPGCHTLSREERVARKQRDTRGAVSLAATVTCKVQSSISEGHMCSRNPLLGCSSVTIWDTRRGLVSRCPTESVAAPAAPASLHKRTDTADVRLQFNAGSAGGDRGSMNQRFWSSLSPTFAAPTTALTSRL